MKPRVGTLAWLRTLETTRGNKREAFQRTFARGNRKAWITRHRYAKPPHYTYRFAWRGDIASHNGGSSKTLTLAMYHVAGWLKDANT